tara:strand:- start:1593 stop:3317 length:1725 start_codon:yes stop_codon:yes gene_type:complete
MAGYNGSVSWGLQPLDLSGGSAMQDFSFNFRKRYLISANAPMRYEVRVYNAGMTEADEPSKGNFSSNKGDIVNVIFDVYATNDYPTDITANWDKLASIRKARDIANRHYKTDGQPNRHRFTVDISRICQDLLSYSLVPIKKGTWQSYKYGGMNGGSVSQDNVMSTVSEYNVSDNGCYKHIKVVAKFEIMKSDGTIELSTSSPLTSNIVTIINSVSQVEKDNIYYNSQYVVDGTEPTTDSIGFMSNCPNHNISTTPDAIKSVRMEEEAEWLYWFQRKIYVNTDDDVSRIRLHCKTDDGNTFYLKEFSDTLDKSGNYNQDQYRVCVQNVSPAYINENNGTTYTNATDTSETALTVASYPNGIIEASTSTYRVSVQYVKYTGGTVTRHTHYRHFKIDRETEHTYGYVRFHWLNRLGGIDSYTAKRDVVEGMSIDRSTVTRMSSDKSWNQNQYDNSGNTLSASDYISNTMRGGDIYKGGREVQNIDANRNYSVYTEPLNRGNAEWLEEIMTSPNVWVELETDATRHLNDVNPYQRPSTKEYIPVIITNGDIETLNQENGLVKFNIEYTLAHKVVTQRN